LKSGGFSRPFQGLTVCGDSFVTLQREGFFVAAVIDGLGHGYDSSVAAVRAGEVIQQYADLPVGEIVLRCHRELKPTRGAAVGVLRVADSGEGQFCGVGNIEVQALSGQAPSLFCTAGIVGHNLRTHRVLPFSMKPGDVYCLFSDGVSARGNLKSCLPGAPESVARRIVEQFGRAHDDATALVLGHEAEALLRDEL
jgi:hypothetical protein